MTDEALSALQGQRKRLLFAFAVLLGASVLFIRSAWDVAGVAHEAIEKTGLALILVAVLGRAWCALYIGGRKKTELVREGPYSLSRNPLYVFSIIGAAGIGAAAGSLVLSAVLAGICFFVFHWITRREEAFLAEAFGAAFARYSADVPRFFPAFGKWRDADQLMVTPRTVVRTLFESSLFFLAFPAFEAVEWLQQSRWLIVQIVLP